MQSAEDRAAKNTPCPLYGAGASFSKKTTPISDRSGTCLLWRFSDLTLRRNVPFAPEAVAGTPFRRVCVSAGQSDRAAGHLRTKRLRLLPLVPLACASYIASK